MALTNLWLWPIDIAIVQEGWAPDGPITFEGVAIALAFAALFAYRVYTAMEPHFE